MEQALFMLVDLFCIVVFGAPYPNSAWKKVAVY